MVERLNLQKITRFVTSCKVMGWGVACKILHFALFPVTPGKINSKSNRMIVLSVLCYTRYTRVTPAGVTLFALFSLAQNGFFSLVTYTLYKKIYIRGRGGDAAQESLWVSGVTGGIWRKYVESLGVMAICRV